MTKHSWLANTKIVTRIFDGSVRVDPRGLPPAVIIERRLSGVAGLAQRAEVVEVVGAAVFQRENVVDLLDRRVATCFQAVFAEWAGGDVGGGDLTPPCPIAAVDLRITLILPVPGILGFRMLLAVAPVG